MINDNSLADFNRQQQLLDPFVIEKKVKAMLCRYIEKNGKRIYPKSTNFLEINMQPIPTKFRDAATPRNFERISGFISLTLGSARKPWLEARLSYLTQSYKRANFTTLRRVLCLLLKALSHLKRLIKRNVN